MNAGLSMELRRAWRRLLRAPGFSLSVIMLIALSIGGVAAVATAGWSLFGKPLPYSQADQLVVLSAYSGRFGMHMGLSEALVEELNQTNDLGRIGLADQPFDASLGGTLKPQSEQAPFRLHSEELFGLIGDFQAALDTFNPVNEPVISCVKRGIGAGQMAQMSNDSGLALLKINQASAVFPLRIAHFGQLLPDHAQVLKDQIFDLFVHGGSIAVRRVMLRAPTRSGRVPPSWTCARPWVPGARMIVDELVRVAWLLPPGLALGVAGGYLVQRLVESRLYQASLGEPGLWLLTAGAIEVTIVLAALVPTLRGAGVAPMEALRHELRKTLDAPLESI